VPRAQDDREREREQDQQDEQRDRDPEPAARLGRVGGRQRGRRFGGLAAAVTREHVLLVDAERAGIGPQKTANEHIGRQARMLVVLELVQDPDGDARALRELGNRDVLQLSFASEVASE